MDKFVKGLRNSGGSQSNKCISASRACFLFSHTATMVSMQLNATQRSMKPFFLFLNVLRLRFRTKFYLYFCKGLKIFEWESGWISGRLASLS